jgi:hypothetical protein
VREGAEEAQAHSQESQHQREGPQVITVLTTDRKRRTLSMSTRSARRVLTGAGTALLATLALCGAGTATATAAECPNEQTRIENNSSTLPDCRAYEQVTPTFKEGIGMGSIGSEVKSLSSAGASVAFTDMGSFAGDLQDKLSNAYLARRTANGWITEPTAPGESEYQGVTIQDSSADLDSQLLEMRRSTEASNAANFYLRKADGALTFIGRVIPEADATEPPGYETTSPSGGGVEYIGASEDLSHVMFYTQGLTVNFPGTSAVTPLLEYTGTGNSEPQVVDVTNTGESLEPCGISQIHGHPLMSRDGRTIAFAEGSCEGRHETDYVRVGGATTIELSSSQCTRTSSDPGGACNDPSDAGIAGASANGSVTYITTSQQLVNSDVDQGQDLYACILPAGSIVPQGSVNPCPSLEAISVTGTSAGANVQEVVDVSEDGNRVAFTATGVLAGTSTNAAGQAAVEGAENLYMYDRAGTGEHMKFIGDLCSGSGMSGSVADPRCPQSPSAVDEAPEAQMAPADGRYMIFSTYARLDSGDTDEAQDVYRYDAETGALARISIGGDGYGEDGNATDANAAFPITYHGFPSQTITFASFADFHKVTAISENGERVFFTTTEALVPQDTNGQEDVYEWENGRVSLISDGVAPNGSKFVSATPSGDDVVFITADQLTWQDGDTTHDAYDARVDGGFPMPAAAASCSGEACQGSPPTAGAPPTPGSGTLTGAGNISTESSAGSSSPLTVSATKTVAGPGGALSVKVAGPGRLAISGAGLKSTSVRVTKAGTVTIKVLLTDQARARLRKRHTLKISAKVLFTAASGQTATATVALTFKEAHSSKSASKARKGHS